MSRHRMWARAVELCLLTAETVTLSDVMLILRGHDLNTSSENTRSWRAHVHPHIAFCCAPCEIHTISLAIGLAAA